MFRIWNFFIFQKYSHSTKKTEKEKKKQKGKRAPQWSVYSITPVRIQQPYGMVGS
jgi:hypothetical protein